MFFLKIAKNVVKDFIYLTQLILLFHKLRNKNNLTVVMFHRVLSVDDPRWSSCDLEWTVSDHVFEQCLVFFKRFYNIISLDDLVNSYNKGSTLPSCPLLITFDDGWSDNEEYALPLLQKYDVPAVIFIVSEAIDKVVPFWEEHLFICWKSNQLSTRFIGSLPEELRLFDLKDENNFRVFISKVNNLPVDKKKDVVQKIVDHLPTFSSSSMLSTLQLDKLIKAGIAIGSHGMTHTPLTYVDNLEEELCVAKMTVQTLLNKHRKNSDNICMSFPHGSYNEQVISKACDSGYKLLFTSDPYLVPLASGQLKNMVLGRISIPHRLVVDEKGQLSETKLAFWLMNRKQKAL